MIRLDHQPVVENHHGAGPWHGGGSRRRMDLRIPLRQSPTVVQIGMNVHGRLPRERYCLPGLWCIHLYHYAGALELGGQRSAFSPGYVSVTPPDTDIVWHMPSHAPQHFAHIRFSGKNHDDVLRIPVLTDLGGQTAGHTEAARIDRVIAAFSREPHRAHAWAWDLLWRLVPSRGRGSMLAGVPGTGERAIPPALQIVLTVVDLELDRPHALTGLARRAGISPNHLLRLFRTHCKTTVMGWIRQRRAERAQELLTTTNLPLADIARSVGCQDLQVFNKLVRRGCGASPRELRNRPGDAT